MFLANLKIENFRAFGSQADARNLDLSLTSGLNLLVGENDSGKTAIIDAIRHLLWTTSQDYHRLTDDDFHIRGADRADSLTITATFKELSILQQAAFLEYLTLVEGEEPSLCISLIARRHIAGPGARGRASVVFRAGEDLRGPTVEGALREFLRCTYLKPLRDAEGELTAGKNSRLSQILKAHPDFADQANSDWVQETPAVSPTTLVGIMKQAEHLIKNNTVVQSVHDEINTKFLTDLSLGTEILTAAISVARSADLQQILEKLELALGPHTGADLPTRRGLGLNNVLFMATELLLLGASDTMPLLLIEEPEAHLHPQMQLRLMEMLELRASAPAQIVLDEPPPAGADATESDAEAAVPEIADDLPPPTPEQATSSRVQILVTTHSPILASKVEVGALTLITNHKAFSLASDSTRLDSSDYAFLRRFLDSTKANLFFAKSVMVVEGDGENILLPAIAQALGRSFSKYGVSIVNVGHRGLFRYSRVFQRQDDRVIPVRVACVADRDIPPREAATYVPAAKPRKENEAPPPKFVDEFTDEQITAKVDALKARDGDPVRTFVSPSWTLEHDLALSGLEVQLFRAVALAAGAKSKDMTEARITKYRARADQVMADWKKDGKTQGEIAALSYKLLYEKNASKAETAQFFAVELEREKFDPAQLAKLLPKYLIEAIEYVTAPLAMEGVP
ncbi:putative ATP-dependent endonuclease of OLD family [Agrobacterium tumefaciens]|uniref:ATP-dependent endonuclease of OLD family n=1 Tax=Agrobacterium radiobacter TaxID=362 RepID=A0ABR6JEW9_AGRRD|nr:AAA family ATPase [Agrobacterium radiobacter]TGE76500.1 ATP-dependent endonuclease [Rhizobium sp. SEMIA 439]MBB4284274.1 putative ATP-dependent endonuclease of OLD family [Agrobacterium radiobacter]MBB4321561.1 putative ATP-dependent endonuclease of OLD family [Agrobacterium radiobacter]MBB4326177.1 putative ATP-dependent endonuclease of OLD family [Agrobacterium radiobacter]MBB4338601.1 putative ATP-dependent endonuclease of OLD family [Agrobacterium radiobacter]